MGHLRQTVPSMLVVAAFSRHAEALAWATDKLTAEFGPIALASDDFSFHHTTYYEATMGPGLRKRFLAFASLVEPDVLPELKHRTNTLEAELAGSGKYLEPRPLNLDPGLLQLGKFLLASTKDQGHRIYLRDGIFAEITLRYQEGAYHPWPWTYADYREPALHEFLLRAREEYRQRLGRAPSTDA
ncbi:MAG: DUF4416 family protein [Planctomycetes bacterium]|nr:DUF4416 family protein [Planctomycetota bacterium]